MKAVLWTTYGGPELLALGDVEKPVAKDNEVLIKIHATSVTAGDCELRKFKIHPLFWLPLRLYMGLLKPRRPLLGQEISGIIEAVGNKVTKFKKGDQVFGNTTIKFGGYAQYVCLTEKGDLALKPVNITHNEAAVLPIGGINTLHFLRKGNVKQDQKVLIFAASGSMGTIAVQLAKHLGAEVTAVCGPDAVELVKSLGADIVIDYKKTDFTKTGETYDVIFDTIGKSDFKGCVNSLKSQGRYLSANPSIPFMIRKFWTNATSSKRVIFEFAVHKPDDLVYLMELMEAKKIKMIIDKTYPLEQMAEAHAYVDKGYKIGNVAITVQGRFENNFEGSK